MQTIKIENYEMSNTFNGVTTNDKNIIVILIHGAGGQEIDWPMAWRSTSDLTRTMDLTPPEYGGGLDDAKSIRNRSLPPIES